METITRNEKVEPQTLKKALPNAGVLKRISLPTHMLQARLRQINEETQK